MPAFASAALRAFIHSSTNFAGSDDGLVQFDLRDRRRCGDRGSG
jgi:hypothetical protein